MSLLWTAHWYCKVCRRCAPGMPSPGRDVFLSQGLGQNLGASFCVLKRLLIFLKCLLIFVKRLLFFVKRLLIFGGTLVAYGRHTFCSGVPPITYCVLVVCVKSGTGGTPFLCFHHRYFDFCRPKSTFISDKKPPFGGLRISGECRIFVARYCLIIKTYFKK